METSLWSATLHDFRDSAGSTTPVPAGVSICAVTASLALALLTKVLAITGKRKSFAGDPAEIASLIEAAQVESLALTRLADDDARAFTHYLHCVRNKQDTSEAMRQAIHVPMEAARSAARGVALSRRAAVHCSRGMMASDLAIAASLLSGAGQAMLISVESNLALLPPEDSFAAPITAELPVLKNYLLR